MQLARDADGARVPERSPALARRTGRGPGDWSCRPARHPGAFQQALDIQHPVVARCLDGLPRGREFAPGGTRKQRRAPAPQCHLPHAGYVRTHRRDRRETFLDQPVDLDPRQCRGQVGGQRQRMNHVAHGRRLDDQDPHGAALCRSSPRRPRRPAGASVPIAVRVAALPAPAVGAGLLDRTLGLPAQQLIRA